MRKEYETVSVDDADGIRLLTLDRPAVRNALSRALARDLLAALADAAEDPGVRGVVLTGAGPLAFSAGADLQEASALDVAGVPAWLGGIFACYRQILLVPKPVVAALNGIAAGGGYQIALVSDWRIGCAQTRMSQPEILAGFPSIMGSYWMTLHLPWGLNQELSYSGRAMGAEECRRVGLLHEIVDAADLVPRARACAAELADRGLVAFRETKARFATLALRGFEEAAQAAITGMQAAYANGEPQAAIRRFREGKAKR
jgi:enoyl-CoA hydratase/carnithine racemase